MTESHPEILAEGKYLKLIKQGTWEYADRTRGIRAVAVLAVTADRELVLTEQFRVPVGRMVIDLPAGLVGDAPGEEEELMEIAAQRELLEETGFSSDNWTLLVMGPTTAGMASELVAFYLATDARRVAQGGGVEGEQIQVHCIPLERIMTWLKQQEKLGVLIDVKTYFAAAWLAARNSGNRQIS